MTLPPLKIDYNTFLKDHFVLPPLSLTLTRLLEVVNSQQSSIQEVSDLISRDAAMVSHILKVVNSAYYAVARPIGNVRHAIAYLGLAEVSRIVLTLSVINALKVGDKRELASFWHHSYLTAIIGKRLVKQFKHAYDIEDLYAAALLHDVGELVYQRFFPEHYRVMNRFCSEQGCFLIDAEEHFGLPSHITFGSLLCDHWRLPKSIKRACEFHELRHLESIEDITSAHPFDIIIAVSNLLAVLVTDPLKSWVKEQVAAQIRRVLGKSEEEFLLLMGDVYDLKLEADQSFDRMMTPGS